MLKRLKLQGVGPATEMDLNPLAERFNLFTGDNGLGKTFLLDAMWWTLTTTWPGKPAYPRNLAAKRLADHIQKEPSTSDDQQSKTRTLSQPRIEAWFETRSKHRQDLSVVRSVGSWHPVAQRWQHEKTDQAWQMERVFLMLGNHPNEGELRAPALTVYARVDGSIAVWDPYLAADAIERFAEGAVILSSDEVWQGNRAAVETDDQPRTLCRGLLEDLKTWHDTASPEFLTLTKVLTHLSAPDETLRIGPPVILDIKKREKVLTIATSYGDVPMTLASAGVKRVLGLAYALVWAWSWHQETAAAIGRPTTTNLVMLIDELELHLHPKWQRKLPGALLQAVDTISSQVQPQFFITTHAPMVLASFEPVFSEKKDALWLLDLVDGEVEINRDEWRLRGNVDRWLVPEVFDLKSATSPEAEVALSRAQQLLATAPPDPTQVREAHKKLCELLPAMDPFFVRWNYYMRHVLNGEGGQ